MNLSVVTGLLLLFALSEASKLYRINIGDAKSFQQYAMDRNLDIWSMRNDSANVEVSDDMEDEIKSLFNAQVVIEDVTKVIKNEMEENENVRTKMHRFRAGAAPTSHFARYREVVSWLQRLSRENEFVTIRSIGKSHEGRDMIVARIGKGREARKPAVFIMGGIHAREWLAAASTIYFIDKLATGAKAGDKRITNLLLKYDFYVSPLSNPDGYEYTHQDPYTRKWRKTRRPQVPGCTGADPNRNFDVKFGQKGAHPDPCHIIYPGPHAFSEKCTSNIRDFALSSAIRGRIKLFYDVHAFSQMYFVPFAFDRNYKAKDDEEMRRVARISNGALMRVNGRRFTLGAPGEILYDASGSTMDWFKLKAGVKYAYAFEVFPNMYSPIGFLARTSDIGPSGKEISEAILTAAENIRI